MAEIVIGLGTSHSPLCATDAPMWEQRAISDRSNPELFDLEGELRSYDDLARINRSYEREASIANLTQQSRMVQASLDRLADALAAARPDVVLIVGDDQHELFDAGNLPAISIFYGDKGITHTFGTRRIGDPEFMRVLSKAYAMDEHHEFECDGEFARGLIEHLIESGIDIGACGKVSTPDTHGFGHAYGFVMTRLMTKVRARVVPVMLNTYYPPNQPTPARCYAIGRAIRAAIDASPLNRRVAVVASGGLSHFVTNEPLDHRIINALKTGDATDLCRLPVKLLKSGASEIRNWIAVAGILDGVKTTWLEYVPVYRTPAGTGIGLAFARWL
jgi:Catalytic LigB subunit of aromatic ring-opening dioxygenase